MMLVILKPTIPESTGNLCIEYMETQFPMCFPFFPFVKQISESKVLLAATAMMLPQPARRCFPAISASMERLECLGFLVCMGQ